MKMNKKILSVIAAVVFAASFNWGYAAHLLSLISSAAVEIVSGESTAGAALNAELQSLSLNKFFELNAADFFEDLLKQIADDDSSDESDTTDDLTFEDTTTEAEENHSESGRDSRGRMDLAGKTHPVSGVKFDSNGFPIFESKYDTKLDPQDYLKSRGTHFDRASKALYNDIMNDSNLRSQFTEAEIAIFKEGGVPKAYTWHHHQDEGVMQLVDRKIHRQTGHTGGFSIWGPGN